jgi:hypothetical protein
MFMVIKVKMPTDLTDIQSSYPFLSLISVGKNEYVGIIQNADPKVLSIYVYELLPYDLKQSFLEYGANWWWESNRKIPINIFIGKEFKKFRPYLRTYSLKETRIIFGPVTRLSALTDLKRVRRKTVQLLRTVK